MISMLSMTNWLNNEDKAKCCFAYLLNKLEIERDWSHDTMVKLTLDSMMEDMGAWWGRYYD